MFDKFSERHIGVSNEKDLKAMLEVIGAKSVDELISQVIPQSIRLKKPLALPAEGMSEYEFAAHIRSLADRNRCLRSFIVNMMQEIAFIQFKSRIFLDNLPFYLELDHRNRFVHLHIQQHLTCTVIRTAF